MPFELVESEPLSKRDSAGRKESFSDRQALRLRSALARLPVTFDGLHEALPAAVREVCLALGWPAGHAFIPQDKPGSFRSRAWYASSRRRFAPLKRSARQANTEHTNPLLQKAMESKALLHTDIAAPGQERPSSSDSAQKAGIREVYLLPILAENRVVAILQFFVSAPAPDRARATSVLEALGHELGMIAERERMRDAVRRAAQHVRTQTAELDHARAQLTDQQSPPALQKQAAETLAVSETGAQSSSQSAAGLHDEVTGLPTRMLLIDRIGQAIRRRARRPEDVFAVLVVAMTPRDMDEAAADVLAEVLAEVQPAVARRLILAVRPADTVAHGRCGEFGMLLESVERMDDAREVARRIHNSLEQPLPHGDSEVRIRAHIGIVLGRSSYDDPESLLRDAAVAMRQAAARDADFQVFDFAAQDYADKVHKLEADLRAAMENRELFLEYLPIVSLDSGRLTGLEALMRWKHPDKGLVPPKVFVPVLVASPLVHEIGHWVIDSACRQLNDWRRNLPGIEPPSVAINISARQLLHKEFAGTVQRTLAAHGVEGHRIRLDIAESELMQDAAKAAAVLAGLRAAGIEVAIDDFGTGYSSLSQLHSFPAAALKIDRAFVSRPGERERQWGVARTIIELARILDMEVIAEGIETREQLLQLRQLGCHQAQGFLFSGPVDPVTAEKLIKDGYPLDLSAIQDERAGSS